MDGREVGVPLVGTLARLCLFLLFSITLASCGPDTQSTTGLGSTAVQQAPKTRLIYVAIGASDTYGQGADDPHTESWPADLAAKLGSDVRLINLGIPGVIAHQALTTELPVALDSHPDLVTIWLAVNDLADNVPLDSYSHDLDTLVSDLQAGAPHARILLANVPDLTLLPAFNGNGTDLQKLQAQIVAYNGVIAAVVKRHHVLLLNLYQQWQELQNHPEYISNDGLHPSTVGYARLADLFYQTLQSISTAAG